MEGANGAPFQWKKQRNNDTEPRFLGCINPGDPKNRKTLLLTRWARECLTAEGISM